MVCTRTSQPQRPCQGHVPRSPPPILTVIVALLLVSGCGSSNNGVATKSATQILVATKTAAENATSVHLITRSRITHGGPVSINASLAKDKGHVTLALLGMRMQVIRDGEAVYLTGNQTFAARTGAVLGLKIPANTWLKGPAKGMLAQTGAVTNITTELPVILSGSGKVTKDTTTKINGQPAIALKLVRKLYTGTLYVATTGEPYPLKLIKTATKAGPSESGQTTFTDWNQPVTVTPPANAIDITQLQHLKKKKGR
jgi:hypothetical protein